MEAAYIYLLQDGRDIGTDIYKIGMTIDCRSDTRKLSRLCSYSDGTLIEGVYRVSKNDVVNIERDLIDIFQRKYTLERGREWFRGDPHMMFQDIYGVINKYKYSNVYIERTVALSTQNRTFVDSSPLTTNMNDFGKEDMSYVTQEFMYENCQKLHGEGILNCIKHIFFNPDHPENQTMRLITQPKLARNNIAVIENGVWVKKPKSIIRTVIDKTRIDLMACVTKHICKHIFGGEQMGNRDWIGLDRLWCEEMQNKKHKSYLDNEILIMMKSLDGVFIED